jgi:DNA modification methylase
MTILLGDCLEHMKKLKDGSVDLLFCDLPYGQTSCKWDCLIDLTLFWKEVNRVCKINCPMFFTCSTKFGVSLINSNPKNFRYDMVWVKSSPCGFLNAKKMPMKKHELVYVFYRKLPFYDISSHKHKFLKDTTVLREEEDSLYGKETGKVFIYDEDGKLRNSEPRYDPPLPTSVMREVNDTEESIYGKLTRPDFKERQSETNYDPPLPTSIITEMCKYDVDKNAYGGGKQGRIKISKKKEDHETKYQPPLPTSILEEETFIRGKKKDSAEDVYGADERINSGKLYHHSRKCQKGDDPIYEPALPTTVVRETDDDECYNGDITYNYADRDGPVYEPPLPHSILEIKSEKGKHATQKPTALIEWILKYYSKDGDTVLDPTAGSGSTAIACINMNRKYICIEKDPEIFKGMDERIKERLK